MMLLYYRPNHFKLEELIPPETWQALGRKAWLVLDPRALFTLDQLREAFGVCIVNTWHEGGMLKYRGFRPPECKVGAHYSQHRFGRGFDCTFRQSSEIVRQTIMEHRDQFPYLTTLESDVSWVHFDIRDHGGEDIELVHP